MLSWAVVLILGIPSLVWAGWYANIAYNGDCVVYLIGPTQCGPSLYINTVIGTIFFLFTLWLAYLWRD
ncbi:MAG: hypothetical protein K2Q18_18920 [Bdellovibrionales bacterium]|nr:hypothetical protein [Bdellovibrionales bacterium]